MRCEFSLAGKRSEELFPWGDVTPETRMIIGYSGLRVYEALGGDFHESEIMQPSFFIEFPSTRMGRLLPKVKQENYLPFSFSICDNDSPVSVTSPFFSKAR